MNYLIDITIKYPNGVKAARREDIEGLEAAHEWLESVQKMFKEKSNTITLPDNDDEHDA